MHDLDTIKRLNRNPSKREEQRKPAPQPTRTESRRYAMSAAVAVASHAHMMQSPAMKREPLDGAR